jgi:transposase-like protein
MAIAKRSVSPAPRLSSSGIQSSSVRPKPTRTPRHILSEDQKSDVIRLYAETTTPLAEIKQQFGLAESSLYRLIQQRGVTPRGRASSATRSVSNSARGRAVLNRGLALSRQIVRSRSGVSARQTPLLPPSSESGIKYRVSFAARQIVTAVDIRDAIRQAEKLGATEVTAIIRSE